MTAEILIVGIGDDGPRSLPPEILKRLDSSSVLVGGERHLTFFPEHKGQRIVVKGSMTKVLDEMERHLSAGKGVVVLASGDPLFYGFGKLVTARFGKARVTILPAVSSMQLAFARIREPWDDATLVSCHAKPLENLVEAARESRKLGVFTDDKNTPSAIARALMAAGLGNFRVYVCENLGGTDEHVVEASLEELTAREFSSLNVMILIRQEDPAAPPVARHGFGVPEEYFEQKKPRRGLITKWEVRVVSLSRLELERNSVVWDIGAGSGSVSIEAARLAPEGHVYAIEKDDDDARIVEKNQERFGTRNVTVIHGKAPQSLEGLPPPDAVFIGGSGGELASIVRGVVERLKPGGRLVANMATLENLTEMLSVIRTAGLVPHISQLTVARSKAVLDLTAFESLNPVYVVYARKPDVK